MKRLGFLLLIFCAFTAKAQNLILNGSFEINTPVSTYPCISFDDGNLLNITNYSGATMPLIKDSCLVCSPPTFLGGGAAEGNWFVEITSFPNQMIFGGEFSFNLFSALSDEKNYKLSFSIRKPPQPPLLTNGCSDPANNYIKVGISNYDNQFGTLLYTSPLGSDEWQEYSVVFNTQNAEEFITVKAGVGDTNNWVVHIDNFVLVENPEPVGVQEVNSNNKQLLKIVDILGRESKPTATGLLFYIYSDGTVEKKVFVE